MTCSQGALSALLIEPGASAHTFDANSEIYDFLYEGVQKRGRIIGGRAITGSRSQYAMPTREGHYQIGGPLATYTNSADLDLWLPRILGAAESTNTFELAETIPAFGMLIDRVGGILQYDDLVVNSCLWKAQAGPGDSEPEFVEQVLTVVGKTETLGTSWPGTPPTLSTAANRGSYILSDSVLTVGGTTFAIKSCVMLVDNRVRARWVNSLSATELCPSDRIVMLRVYLPFTASSDAVFSGIYQHASQLTGVTSDITFTNGSYSTKFAFTGLQWAKTSPVVKGKTEILLPVTFIARKTSTTSELIVTNVSA